MSDFEMKYVDNSLAHIIELLEWIRHSVEEDKDEEYIEEVISVARNQLKELCKFKTNSVWPTEQYIRNRAPELSTVFDKLLN